MGCGVLSFGVLVFCGCCQVVFQICFLVGVIGWGSINLRFGIWFLHVCFGTIWLERNRRRRIFENVERTDSELH